MKKNPSELLCVLDGVLCGIRGRKYLEGLADVGEWGGADVIICRRMSASHRRWIGEQSVVISFQNIAPGRRVVATKFSRELSWLFYRLRDAFDGYVDYTTKYDFYGGMADAATAYLHGHPQEKDARGLLEHVLSAARTYARTRCGAESQGQRVPDIR